MGLTSLSSVSGTVSTVLAVLAVVILGTAALLTLIRMSRGPSSLDRVVAGDVLIAVVIAALAIEAVVNRHATTLPVVLVLSLVGFAGSLSMARFVAGRDRRQDDEPGPERRREPGPGRDEGSQ